MAGNPVIEPAAEFSKLNIEEIIAAPLTATVKAQGVAAEATKQFIEGMMDDPNPSTPNAPRKLREVAFRASFQELAPAALPSAAGAAGVPPPPTTRELDIRAPLLAIVPTPHLRIDSLTINFQYQINQVLKDSSLRDASASIDVATGGLLSSWVKATLKGTVATKSSQESTTNRSGTLDITVHASEAPMPEGLAKLLSMLASTITAKTA